MNFLKEGGFYRCVKMNTGKFINTNQINSKKEATFRLPSLRL